jgi:hypothetical protein
MTMTGEPYDDESAQAPARSVEEARADLGLEDGGDVEDLDLGALGRHSADLPPVVAEDAPTEEPRAVIDQALIAKLDLGPRDVLAVIAIPEINNVEALSQYSHALQQALNMSGHENLVLVFPHGTKLKKLTLDDQQMARLRHQAGTDVVEGEEPEPVMRSQWSGFDRE